MQTSSRHSVVILRVIFNMFYAVYLFGVLVILSFYSMAKQTAKLGINTLLRACVDHGLHIITRLGCVQAQSASIKSCPPCEYPRVAKQLRPTAVLPHTGCQMGYTIILTVLSIGRHLNSPIILLPIRQGGQNELHSARIYQLEVNVFGGIILQAVFNTCG